AFEAFEMHAEALGCLEDYTDLVRSLPDLPRVVRLCAAIEAARETMALARTPRSEKRWHANVATVRSAMPPPEFDAAWQLGKGLALGDAIHDAQAASADAEMAA